MILGRLTAQTVAPLVEPERLELTAAPPGFSRGSNLVSLSARLPDTTSRFCSVQDGARIKTINQRLDIFSCQSRVESFEDCGFRMSDTDEKYYIDSKSKWRKEGFSCTAILNNDLMTN